MPHPTDKERLKEVVTTIAQTSSSRSPTRGLPPDDKTSMIIRNPAPDGSPPRSNSGVRTFSISH